MRILGVRIDNLSKKEILEKIEFFLIEEKFHQIATVNPEFILAAQADADFRKILNDCDLNVADGVGIWYAFLRFGKFLQGRFAGVDLLAEILQIASEKKLSIFLAISKDGLSSFAEIKSIIQKKYPDLKIEGADIGINKQSSVINHHGMKSNSQFKINDCDILICNFGAPWQERFIKNVKSAKIRLAIGVGGSFDFLTGKIARAPIWLRKVGLEWLWRFAQEPVYRSKRIFKAVIIFPIKILFSKK